MSEATQSLKTTQRLMSAMMEKKRMEVEDRQMQKIAAALSDKLAETIGKNLLASLGPFMRALAQGTKLSKSELQDVFSSIVVDKLEVKVDMPEVRVPEIKVPEVHMPEVKVPEAKVTVKVPPIKLPTINVPKPEVTVNVPEIKMPDRMKVDDVALRGVDARHPLPVVLIDPLGNPVTAFGGMSTSGGGGPRVVETKQKQDIPVGYEQLAVSTTAVAFASIPSAANKAVVVVEDATIRYREDGTAPTATIGTKVFQNSVIVLEGRQRIGGFQAIRQSTTNANLSINYYEVR